jgi:hypothetical protein
LLHCRLTQPVFLSDCGSLLSLRRAVATGSRRLPFLGSLQI